ncbi:dynamin family protein [Acidithiobacillus concretivorus]|uniref:Dynamin N-terminal domain-containing protein n=1 Tax=Acidithiobacillus concretivorus TaxID=3063952 RepID=A0ABS5ZM72_9PROT|nr:dynamin family protein [Acidithiobacillus concretivorus]MBU2737689.1 hypothetical protein [Acidithiobacillus concretivorus]
MNKRKRKAKKKLKKLNLLNNKAIQKLVMPNEMRKSIQEQQMMPSDPFDVLVIATMSAGKSTLINALLGRELLHAANEATTACLTSIEHRDTEQFYKGSCYAISGDKISMSDNISGEQMRLWNADPNVNQIEISGSFFGLPGCAHGLVLHDTPGPNNSRDEQHEIVMQEALDHVRSKIIVYILNTEQLGTNDDKSLLMVVRKKLEEDIMVKIVFVLNKIDLLDIERGENVRGFIFKTKEYLERLGFGNPEIIPIASNSALYARKFINKEMMTSMQLKNLNQFIGWFQDEKNILIDSAIVDDKIKKDVFDELHRLENAAEKRKFSSAYIQRMLQMYQLVACSGIRTLEFFIQNHHSERGFE